jgi:hypothetical protein
MKYASRPTFERKTVTGFSNVSGSARKGMEHIFAEGHRFLIFTDEMPCSAPIEMQKSFGRNFVDEIYTQMF